MPDWVLWTFAGIGLIAVASRIYSWILAEPTDLPPSQVLSTGQDVDSDDLATAYASLVGANLHGGNDVTHLRNGVQIFPAMLKAIDDARDSVHFLTYVYWTGDVAQRFGDALRAAAARGCEVRIVLDAAGAIKMDPQLVKSLQDAGCQVKWFHPFRWYTLRRINHRTHRKILVTDGRVAFTGGVGIAEEWEGDARNPNEWRDEHFRIEGPAVHGAQGAFAENWLNTTGEVLAGPRYYPELSRKGEAAVVSLGTARRDDMSPVLVLYWMALATAKRSVDVTTPYFLPDPELVEAFGEAVKRGVRVRLLLPGDHNDSRLVRWSSQALYPTLLEAGVEVLEYTPTMIHSKVTLVDDRWSIVGSANYDNRSLELNHEFTLLVDDTSLNTSLRNGFEKDLNHAVLVEPAAAGALPWWKRRVAAIGLIAREQL